MAAHDLSGRTALVTGAAGDIGKATAIALAGTGCRLVLADLPGAKDRLHAVAEGLDSADVALSYFDVTDEVAVATAVAKAGPDLLVNNAGYQGDFAPVDRYSVEDFRKVMEINAVGVFTVLRATATTLRDAERPGAIVNVASMAGVAGPPNMPAYSAAKGAVIALSKAAAKDLAPYRIRVNSVSPGFIGEGTMWNRQVEMQASVGSQYYSSDPDRVASEMIDQIPLRRAGRLSEVAAAIVFLLSDEASYLTGINLEIAGGAS